MVDARMLDHLSKKEMEKYLNVTRKFHQVSISHGVHLLRMVKYDRQVGLKNFSSVMVWRDSWILLNPNKFDWFSAGPSNS